MRSIAIYAVLSLIAMFFLLSFSTDTEHNRENTLERQQDELDSRRSEVWDLEKKTEVQDDAIYIKDEIISKQESQAKYYVKKIEEKKKTYIKQESDLKKTKQKLTETESTLQKETAKLAESQKLVEELKKLEATEKKETKKKAVNPEKSVENKPKIEIKSVEEPETIEPEPEIEVPEEVEPPKEEPIEEPEPPIETPDEEQSLTVEATAYIAFCDTGCTGITATGYDVRDTIYYEGLRIIATDPDVIPLYSKVRIKLSDGTSFNAISLDTGGAIKGERVDLLVDTTEKALAFGRQTMTVTILN